MLTSSLSGPIDLSSTLPNVDSHVQIVILCGSPCTDLSRPPPLSRTVYAANPELHVTNDDNSNHIDVNEPGVIPWHEWPSSGLTLWFQREPFERLVSRKERQFWSKSMVRLLSCSSTESMPLLELIQILPIHNRYNQCSMEKAFQVLTGNPKIRVLPSLHPLHQGRFSVILPSA